MRPGAGSGPTTAPPATCRRTARCWIGAARPDRKRLRVLGDEETVAKELQRYADAGTTEFLVCPVGTDAEVERTVRFALDYA
jgi:alkanesulfonate monooxygenase SsuD/methylene tetrahydromethanopterin reductase-like flavin-dependent oxidoreductase (luciferase family)